MNTMIMIKTMNIQQCANEHYDHENDNEHDADDHDHRADDYGGEHDDDGEVKVDSHDDDDDDDDDDFELFERERKSLLSGS